MTYKMVPLDSTFRLGDIVLERGYRVTAAGEVQTVEVGPVLFRELIPDEGEINSDQIKASAETLKSLAGKILVVAKELPDAA